MTEYRDHECGVCGKEFTYSIPEHSYYVDEDKWNTNCPFCNTKYEIEFDLDSDDYLFYYLIKSNP